MLLEMEMLLLMLLLEEEILLFNNNRLEDLDHLDLQEPLMEGEDYTTLYQKMVLKEMFHLMITLLPLVKEEEGMILHLLEIHPLVVVVVLATFQEDRLQMVREE
jgi:hypothetical protein